MRTLSGSGRRPASGQILVLFVVSLVAIFAMAALLFDGAHALVLRRQLQNAGDAAALAASNVIQSGTPKGCSATATPVPGSPRTAVSTAAVDAVHAVFPSFPASAIHVSCPDGWNNYAVEVLLDGHSPTFFGGAVGIPGFDVHTTSQAVNGQISGLKFSIVELDPGNPTWPNGRTGCPSVTFGGGPTVVLEGSMQIDSGCGAPVGPFLINGAAASLSLNNGASIRMFGTYIPGTYVVTPTPISNSPRVADPFSAIQAMPTASLPVQSGTRLVLGGADKFLSPGIYVGGIRLLNNTKVFLRPGIYVMQGGGFDIGGQNAVYSVNAGVSSTTDANWATDCTAAGCGVLLYNTGPSMGQLSVGAGATLKLKPYLPSADVAISGGVSDYKNFLLWQDRLPQPTASTSQPAVLLSGGGTVDISGTVYAPSALVYMTGGSGGTAGGTDLTLQFITWDLQIQGNSSFHFYYRSDQFATPYDYGLIK